MLCYYVFLIYLNQSDVLQCLCQSYETALTSSHEQYRSELNQLKEELSVARQQLEQVSERNKSKSNFSPLQ